VRAPFFCGTTAMYIDRRLGQEPQENVISRAPISINMLDCFESMTNVYSSALTDDEIAFIEERFDAALDALLLLDALDQGHPLFRQARIDYNHSVEALCSVDRSYGKARRDTATCAEKVMKGLLSERNVTFEQNHKLMSLAKLLNDHCGLQVDVKLAEKLYTPASVSYEVPVSKQDAIDAHADLLAFLSGIFKQVFPSAASPHS
jgi:hypothetical protein